MHDCVMNGKMTTSIDKPLGNRSDIRECGSYSELMYYFERIKNGSVTVKED